MAGKKLAVVVGVTGGQGGSAADWLLKDGSYRVRGITRNASSEKAAALSKKGVEVVSADLNNVESLIAAFEGANVIFGVTNFFEPFQTLSAEESEEIEYAQGINLAKAAEATSTLEHYIWSTLMSSEASSGGEFLIPHLDGKARVDRYIKQRKELLAKTTFLSLCFFADSLQAPLFVPNLLASSGKYVSLQPAPASTDLYFLGDHKVVTGRFVTAILQAPQLTLGGKYVVAYTEKFKLGHLIESWGRLTGNPTEFVEIGLDDYDRLWPKWGRELGLSFQLFQKYPAAWGLGPGALTGADLGITDVFDSIEQELAKAVKA